MTNFLKLSTYLFLCLSFFACSKDDPQPVPALSRTEAALKYDEDVQFRVPNFSNVTWSSSDEFVGTVDESGKFTAHHVGEAKITATVDGQTLTATVVVEPYVTGIVEPYLNFGGSVQSIMEYEKREYLEDISTVYTVFRGQGDLEKYVGYLTAQGIMVSANIEFIFNLNVIQNVMLFYKERYNYLGKGYNDRDYFESKDGSYRVFISGGDNAYYTQDPFLASTIIEEVNVPW
ncbi:Ig-like domain-containing protein [Sphingobacterium corticibacter]|uniref:BIG2 domain-containing protein n=1 Tax=Sphingobacterium corticibacter TaxID=2171749 RepID=A0A2T8HNH6_9SPHI|nr:Ig-like domain-containing protein [Sphingobacterium corticibacter]PVH26986.1 hypothetical protein DC487_05165 [Sphingobacterium corticibacter]